MLGFDREVGIDIGTTRTRIYTTRRGIAFDEPTVFAVNKEEGTILSIGEQARSMQGRAPEDIEIRAPIQHGIVLNQRDAEQYLRVCLRRARGYNRFLRPNIIVAVPTHVSSMEQRAVIETCRRLHAAEVYSERKAILAALGAGFHASDLRGRMIVDIGGGTTEAAIISLGGILSSNTTPVGGAQLDQAIVRYVRERHRLHIGPHTAEQVRIYIGAACSGGETRSASVKGNDMQTGLPRVIRMTTEDVVEAVQSDLQQILRAISVVFRNTPPELTSDIMDQGVTLTGGVAQLRNLDVFFSRAIGAPVQVIENPAHAVIRGLGKVIQVGHIGAFRKALLSK